MKKNLLSLALCMLPCLALQAGSLHNLHNLREQADKFFKQNNVTRSATNDTCTCVMGDEVVALFVEPSSSRFVIMADDNANGMVLGYGDHATDSTSVPPALRNMLRQYRKSLTLTATVATPSSRRLLPQPSYPPVEPMLKTKWNQDFPYNMCCPTYDGSEASCFTGSVATAIAQVMNYYRYPAVLQDTLYGWNTEHYSLENVNPGTPIMWDDMQDVYDDHSTFEQQDAVAKLNLYCGMASYMIYGLDGSGSYYENAVDNLKRVMGYKYVNAYDTKCYTSSNWERLLQQEIQARRPVALYGADNEGGHCYVLDGCDADGLMHVNWGWSGFCDGYFDIFVLNPYIDSQPPSDEDRLMGFSYVGTALCFNPDSVTDSGDVIETIGNNIDSVLDRIKIISHQWERLPDTNGYTPLTLELYNDNPDSLYASIGFLSWPMVYDSLENKMMNPSDSMICYQIGNDVGVLMLLLPPQQVVKARTYLHFPESGECGVGFWCGNLIRMDTVNVIASAPAELVYTEPKLIEVTDTSVAFVVNYTNQSEEGWAGDKLSYFVHKEENTAEYQHVRFLNMPPNSTLTDTIYFSGLTPNSTYYFYLEEPQAEVQVNYLFTTRLTEVKDVMADVDPSAPCILYNAQGVLLRRFEHKEMAEQFLNTQCASGVYLLKCGQKVHKVQVK